MKGVIFNVVEDVVTEALSADAWDDVVERSGATGAYTSLGSYPDAELGQLVVAISEAADMPMPDVLRLAGKVGFKHLVGRAPHLVEGMSDWQTVIASLDDIIHPEVKKIYPDAEAPGFAVERNGDELMVTYTSSRGLCGLADGLMLGNGTWFDVELEVEHVSCVHTGDEACVMRVSEMA